MENAAKALGIAASILIGLLLLALLIFAYTRFTRISQQEEQNKKNEQTTEFNKRYLAYDKKNITGNKVISLCNMAEENNIKYEGIDDYQINITVNNSEDGINSFNSDSYHEKSSDEKDKLRETIKSKKYNCVDVQYGGRDGRISSMSFEEIE